MWCISLRQVSVDLTRNLKKETHVTILSALDAVGPRKLSFPWRRVGLQDFPSRWLRGRWKTGWDFKQEMNSLKNRRTFEGGFVFSICKMCFLFSCVLSVSKVYGGASLRSFRRWVVWCLDSFFFCILNLILFPFTFPPLPFPVFFESWIFLSCMYCHALAGSEISFGEKHDRCDRVGSPMVSRSFVLPFFNFSSPGFSIMSTQSGNRGVFGNTVHKTWIM